MTAVVAGHSIRNDDAVELWAVIDQEFLTTLQWDPEIRVLFFPESHPVLGWTARQVSSCRKAVRGSNGMCVTCTQRWRASGNGPLPEFVKLPKPDQRSISYSICSVSGCQRIWRSRRMPLCSAHVRQWERMRLPMEEFLAHPKVVGHPPFGPCAVASCTRDRAGLVPYCQEHQRVARHRARQDSAFDVEWWRLTAPAITQDNQVSLRGLHPRAIAEVLYGLQQRVRAGVKTRYWHVRPYCDMVRASQAVSLAAVPTDTLTAQSKATRQLHSSFLKTVLRHGRSPETERHKDE
jgi:hypothetical protein